MIKYLLSILAILGTVFGMGQSAQAQTNKTENILIVYYSVSGNTKEIAEKIHEQTNGDLFRIETVQSYPENYNELVTQAKKEINDGYRPELKTKVSDFARYDTIFIGSPNWWGTIAPAVSSFIDSYDFEGKKVIPFITHGKGGVQNTIKDMTAQCKGADVLQNGWVGEGNSLEGFSKWIENIDY